MTGFPFGNLSGRRDDFLEIAGGNAHTAMDTVDLVSAGGEYEGFDPRYAYTCEFVGCCTLVDGIALFRPVSREQENLIQIAFLRSDIDDDTGAYTERFEAGSFDVAAAGDIQCSDLAIDLLEYFEGKSFKGLPDVKRGLDGREAVAAVEGATGCDLGLFEDFWLGSPGETDVRVGPYLKRDLLEFSYIFNELSYKYGTSVRDIRKIVTQIGSFRPDHLAAVKAYLDCEYVPDVNMPDEKTYRWGDFLEIAGGQADAVKHFGNQGEAMATLSAITGCRIQAYGTDTLIYRASLGSSAAAKLAAGALAMKDRLSGRGDAVEIGRRL